MPFIVFFDNISVTFHDDSDAVTRLNISGNISGVDGWVCAFTFKKTGTEQQKLRIRFL